ncbi:MAG: hypothetical protein E7260_11460 [Lachnospiraceae bacterium]|nr:hypothetical protein [Lachnospiraceae bacterium]
MEQTGKRGFFTGVVKVACVVAAVYAAMVAVGKFVAKRCKELEEKNAGQKNKRYLAVMNGHVVKISEPVEEISIRAYLGGVTLDLTEAELEQDTQINITGLMSGVVIKVPPMVRVELQGTNILSGFANMVPNYETEDLPVITVYAESVMSGIAVQMVPEKEQ